MCFQSSMAWSMVRSISSSRDGRMPDLMMAKTASAAARGEANEAATVAGAPVAGRSRRVALVITASVPSEPTSSPVRS